MKRCADCRHWRWLEEFEAGYCYHPNVAVRSEVTKKLIPLHSGPCRHIAHKCGPDGAWWDASTDSTPCA